MKIIFLDIDGVLNHRGAENATPEDNHFIEDDKMEILKRMVDVTGAYLVLSSNWRYGWREADQGNVYSSFARSYFHLRDRFHEYGLGFLSKTPVLPNFGREKEILYWLSNWEEDKIEAYAILDDEEFYFEHEKEHLIRTNGGEGLLPCHVEQAIQILGQNSRMKYKELEQTMSLDTLKKAGFNPDKGLRFFGYDENMYKKYVLDFVHADYVETAIRRLKEQDTAEAYEAMHKLKALTAYVCVPGIDLMVREITDTLRDGKTEGVMDGLVYVEIVIAEIKHAVLKEN